MRLLCLLSFLSLCFPLITSVPLIHPANGNLMITLKEAADIIDSTCDQCAEKSMSTYAYCLSSLQVPSISHLVNLPGLAIVAMELVLENATNTIETIKGMVERGAYDSFVRECLSECLELYHGAVQNLEEAVNAFLLDHFDTAAAYMKAVKGDAVACDEGFKEKRGDVTPLVTENQNLYDLSNIVLCIISLVSSKPPHHLS